MDAGLHVAAATDMPWILPTFSLTDDIGRPVDQVAGGMEPRGRTHPRPPEWMAAQLLTAEQGLRAVTVDAAYALGDEANRGHLAVGTYGDVTILGGDVTGGATPDEIRGMTVIATIVDRQYLADLAAADAAVTAFAGYYNYHRLHGALGWHTPAERFDGTLFTDRGFEHIPPLAAVAGLLSDLLAA